MYKNIKPKYSQIIDLFLTIHTKLLCNPPSSSVQAPRFQRLSFSLSFTNTRAHARTYGHTQKR